MNARMPAVAGSFYPENTEQLQRQVTGFLNEKLPENIVAKALIVPHAGYCYSGVIAGRGFSYLQQNKSAIKRVILLGPSHRVALKGCAVPSSDIFTTPLGNIKVDQPSCNQLQEKHLAICSDQAHQWEHALEVQLPFLQSCLDDFELIPIVIGSCDPNLVSTLISALLKERTEETIVVVSTDLSHFHPYQQAQALDCDTIAQVLAFKTDITPEDACGCYALNGLLAVAKQQAWQIKLISKANSADSKSVVNLNKTQVVGYASFILY